MGYDEKGKYMRKFVSIVLSTIILCFTLTICASTATTRATRQCPLCKTYKSATVTCDKNSDYLPMLPDKDCTIHSPCVIMDIRQSTASYTCSNPQCQAYYNTYSYGYHTESVYHTFTRTNYNVCVYD